MATFIWQDFQIMPRNFNEVETELLRAVANGDKQAFSQLFYAFHHELGAFVYRLTKSRSLSEEIVQDAFLKIWVSRHELIQVKSFRAYLFTITRNHAFNTLRNETRKTFLNDEILSDMLIAEESTDFYADKEERYAIVEKAVAQLPPQQQKVWRMSKEEGLPHRQIAERLQLSPETVKRHISLAMAAVLRYVKIQGRSSLIVTYLLDRILP